jgi:hypothetical protein
MRRNSLSISHSLYAPLIFLPLDKNVKLWLHNDKKPIKMLAGSNTLSIKQVIHHTNLHPTFLISVEADQTPF